MFACCFELFWKLRKTAIWDPAGFDVLYGYSRKAMPV